jgi:hypothetical protein
MLETAPFVLETAPLMLDTAPLMLETAPCMPRSGDMLLTAPNGVTRHVAEEVVVLDELNARPLAALHKGEGAEIVLELLTYL